MKHRVTATLSTPGRFPAAVEKEIESTLGALGSVGRVEHPAKSSVVFIIEHDRESAEGAITEFVRAVGSTTSLPLDIAVQEERARRKRARMFPRQGRALLETVIRTIPQADLVGYTSDGYGHVLLVQENRSSRSVADEVASVVSSMGFECTVETSWSGKNFRYEVLVDYPDKTESDPARADAGVDFYGVLLARDPETGTVTAAVPSTTDFEIRTWIDDSLHHVVLVDFHGVRLTRDAATGAITASIGSDTDFAMRTR